MEGNLQYYNTISKEMNELNKYKPLPNTLNILKYNKEEKILATLGNVLLVVGFIAAIFLLVSVFGYEESNYGAFSYSRKVLRFEFIAYGICDMLLSLTLWAAMLCLAKMSRNIREMKNNNRI